MQSAPTLRQQEMLARTFARDGRPLQARHILAEVVTGAGFAGAVLALLALDPPGTFVLWPAAACVLVLALSARVQFHVASGFTVPTQLAYVPLLFVVPVAIAPAAVALALILGRLPDVVGGRARPVRLLQCLGNAWFSIGPAAVFAAFGVSPATAGPAILILALVAQFGTDFGVSVLRDAAENRTPPGEQLSEAWVYGVDAALAPVGLAVGYSLADRPALVLGLVPMLGVLMTFARERQGRLESLVQLKEAYQGTALVLGDVVEADDAYTGMHSQGVVELALQIGDRLGLDGEKRRNLEFGALLHDVGKVAIPKELINKPGRLDPEEWHVVKTHTVEGQRMLDRVGGLMREVGMIVRSHHERWDGGGYPDGLAGDEIPIEARIIACCDTWHAMRTNRPYRKALSREAALAELTGAAGGQLDPAIVATLIDFLRANPAA